MNLCRLVLEFQYLHFYSSLVFISSNSSFSKCVRKHDIVTVSPSFLANSNCALPTYTDCSFTQDNCSSLTSSASFTSCTWTKCESTYGGGIYLNVSDSRVTLIVTKGEFYSCKADRYCGGGIYAEGIGLMQVKNSVFYKCVAEATNDAGGGGIEIWKIQKPPNIETTSIIACKSGNDGGGMGIWYASVFQTKCIIECRFMKCEINHTESSDGGSLMVWQSNAAIGCSDTLFVDSHSVLHGGAASYLTYYSSNFNSSIPFFSFCYFKDNSADIANDAYLEDWIPDNPFLHSFSTTSSSKVIYVINNNVWNNPSFFQNKDDWLPLGTSSYLNVLEGSDILLVRSQVPPNERGVFSRDVFKCISFSALRDKEKVIFTSSNSSFTECMRNKLTHIQHLLSNGCPPSESSSICENHSFSRDDHQTPNFSSTFSQCTFSECSSSDSGGAICFQSGGTNSVLSCSFSHCTTSVDYTWYSGGGAVFSNYSSLLSVTSSLFISCSAVKSFGGAVLGTWNCASTVVSLCTFIKCDSTHGGGLSTHFNTSGEISSSRFISCGASYYGAGIYNNNYQQFPFSVSNCLFTNNRANSTNDNSRGGGGFEDYRSYSYSSKYSFSFFTGNVAPHGVGNDISIKSYALSQSSITYCFSTTKENAFYNAGSQITPDWLPLSDIPDKRTAQMKYHPSRRCLYTHFFVSHSLH